MTLHFFTDHCVPTALVNALRAHEHEATRLTDVMPHNSPDPAVIAKAQELDCVLATLNGDFADIVAYPPANFAGIVAFQIHNRPEIVPPMMEQFLAFVEQQPGRDWFRAKLLVVEPLRIRIRT